MTDRKTLARAFLAQTDWAAATLVPLAGDASNRRYDRLTNPDTGETAVLMDAPPDKGEDIRPFARIAGYLSNIGLSAPRILAEDAENGFLLLEDLGDELFARVIPQNPDLEPLLYETATDVLVSLHQAERPVLDHYSPALMTELAALAFSKYRASTVGPADPATLNRFMTQFEDILRDATHGHSVLIQRDYHAENLLWLPDRTGVARVGLLDFQDAMLGHPAYDLVSLLQDARRDVPARIELAMCKRFIDRSGVEEHGFRTAYAVLGVQRNLRIIGVFARLATDYGKPHYVDLIPRVWDHLRRGLDHPALALVAELILDQLPAPSPDVLAKLKPS
ncbi:phosphotransferase [Seohaeicola saemankumensis]|nr:phosphotransferase [Seohaeicola saemankumensis]MCA0870454.1 phosphotransferase [Seohaeicola saemankumensis]